MNKIDHQFPEDVEVFFFLYDTEEKGRQVSERYLIRQGKGQGHRGHRGHDDKMSALFTVSIGVPWGFVEFNKFPNFASISIFPIFATIGPGVKGHPSPGHAPDMSGHPSWEDVTR